MVRSLPFDRAGQIEERKLWLAAANGWRRWVRFWGVAIGLLRFGEFLL